MSNFPSYPTRSFSETQKFFVLDPQTGTPSFVLGSDLVNQLTPNSNYVFAESTRATAQATDYQVGQLIQTAGSATAGDGLASGYLVVPSGDGDFPMDNGNELLVISGDDALREQLISNASGEGSDLVAHTGTANTVTETLDQNIADINQRVIYVGSVAELEARTPLGGQSARITDDRRGGSFVFKSGDQSTKITSDPMQGVWIAPSSDPTGASGAWMRRYFGQLNIQWFGAIPDFDTTKTNNRTYVQACVDYLDSLGGGEAFVPFGVYGFSNETTLGRVIRIPGKNIKFVGESRDGSVFKMLAEDENGLAYSDAVTDPDGFISLFTSFDSSTDISGFTVRNMTLDYNGAENKTIEGYGNLAEVEPLEGVYPGTSGTGFARFRTALYAFFGEGITFDYVTFKDWPRAALNVPGLNDEDVTNASVTNCKFDVTQLNPGTQDWDTVGILIQGSNCKATDNDFSVSSGGFDYYTARTCIQLSGEGAIVANNTSDRWHRLALVGNGGQDAVSRGAIVSDNIVRNAKRGVQLLSRDQAGIAGLYALERVTVTGNSISLDTANYALNNGDPSSPTGIAMLEIESLGVRAVLINDNVIFFEGNAGTVGLGGVSIQPVGAGDINIDLLEISGNLISNSPRSGINVSFADTVQSCKITDNIIRNPGTRDDASAEQLAGVAVRGRFDEVVANNNVVIDSRTTHKINAAVYFTAALGSVNAEALGNTLYVTDGANVKSVHNDNANVLPVTEVAVGTPVSLVTAADGDQTPSVLGWRWGRINNSAATTISDFDDGVEGQEITLLFSNANTTISDNANIDTVTNADLTPAPGDVIKFIKIDNLWRQTQ